MKVLLLLLTSVFVSVFSQGLNTKKLNELFNRIEIAEKAMGSISISHKGKELYQRSFGFADKINEIKAGAATKYRIGSISKSFTAVIIMQMIDEGKLALDTKLSKFYSDLPNADIITIEMLLRHRSGLYNFTNDDSYESWMEEAKTEAELLAIFKADTAIFEPDSKSSYSNTNYVLLSYIAEKIDRDSFKSILEKRIIKSLKLENTYFGGKINSSNKEALSYKEQKTYMLSTETDMSIPMGAGAIVSTPSDVNKFYETLFNGKLVSAASLVQMKLIVGGMGAGLFQFPFHGKVAFGHTGGIDNFRSVAGYFSEEELSVTLMTNALSINQNNILIAVLSIYFNMDYELPVYKESLVLKSEELDQYLGVYSSPTFPLKITISKEGNVIKAQATGQASFAINPYEKDRFNMEAYGIDMIFKPSENKMIFTQGGGKFELTRE